MKRLLAVFVMLMLVMATGSGVTAAQDASKSPVVKKLKPDAGSLTLPGEVLATEKDGNTTISMHAQGKTGVTMFYHIEVSLEKGTYKATQRDIPANWGVKHKEKPKKADESGPVSVLGVYGAEIILISEDLPQYDLANTRNYMSWNVNSGSVVRDSYASSWGCTAWDGTGYPWPLDTHWYNQKCSPTSTTTTQEVAADYINWDWGFDNVSTNVSHWTKILGLGADSYYYWWDYNHTGESSSILQIDLFVDGQQVG